MAQKKRDPKVFIPLIAVIILVLGGAIYWYIDYTSFIRTDDAYVTSDVVAVTPKIMGRISKVYVQEGDSVTQGELLAEIDSTDMIAQKQQIRASQLQTATAKLQAEAKYEYDQKNMDVLKIGLDKAKDDYDRAKLQFKGGVLTQEQYDHIKKAFEIAQAQYDAAKAMLTVSKTQITAAQAAITTAAAQLEVINTQLQNTRLYAPVNGLVARRWLLPGDVVNPGQSVYTINNNSKFWVLVYLEETKIEGLKLGQKALFTLDTYPGVTFKGKIFLLGSTTAAQFSLIPPSNASGNFTKVTQRVPVKISIDETENGGKTSNYRFMTGMSAVVKIVR